MSLQDLQNVTVGSHHYTFSAKQVALSLFFAIVVELILKGMALWSASRADRKAWFVVMLIVNSFGIIPLFYLLFFSRQNAGKK